MGDPPVAPSEHRAYHRHMGSVLLLGRFQKQLKSIHNRWLGIRNVRIPSRNRSKDVAIRIAVLVVVLVRVEVAVVPDRERGQVIELVDPGEVSELQICRFGRGANGGAPTLTDSVLFDV